MSNSWAYPILQTPDVDRALGVVRDLLGVADPRDLSLVVFTRTGRASGLPRYLDAFGHWLDPEGPGEMIVSEVSPLARIEPRDPADPLVSVHLQVGGFGPVEELVTAVGPDQAALTWWFWGFPEVPDLGLGPDFKHGYVELVLNASDVYGGEPAEEHTVFVHTRQWEPQRAEWLVGLVGLTVVGPGEMGF